MRNEDGCATRASRPRQSAIRPDATSGQSAIPAFTLIELMVVIVILTIVIGAVIHVGRLVLVRGKEKETAALLQKLDLAAKEFEIKKPLGKVREYIDRYGNYPPDELDGFARGVALPGGTTVSPAKSDLVLRGAAADANKIQETKHPDIKAFALGVRLFSVTGSAILDDVGSKYRRAAEKDATGPTEFLDRSQPANTQFDPSVDEPLDYFVDGWGTPIGYFAFNCDCFSPANPGTSEAAWEGAAINVPTPGNGDRVATSRSLLQLNNGVPFFVSYGADGPEQFAADFNSPGSREAKDLVWDFKAPDDAFDKQNRFDNRFNADNVYSHEGLKEKIAAFDSGP